jgi:hypothetical protein
MSLARALSFGTPFIKSSGILSWRRNIWFEMGKEPIFGRIGGLGMHQSRIGSLFSIAIA